MRRVVEAGNKSRRGYRGRQVVMEGVERKEEINGKKVRGKERNGKEVAKVRVRK